MRTLLRTFPLIAALGALLAAGLASPQPVAASKRIEPSPQGGTSSSAGPNNASPAQFWSDDFYLSGPNAEVSAIATRGTEVYIAGSFRFAGPVAANRIARWDGDAWHPLGKGTNREVRALAVDSQGNLYAGGAFTEIGGIRANHIARWDGDAWHPLASGTRGEIYALAVDSQGNLYAGGQFFEIGGITAHGIARWDGNAWHAIGDSSNVMVLAVDSGGNLYAWGGGVASGIARWDGSAWHVLGDGIDEDGHVEALAIDSQGNVYASVYKLSGASIARWDGTAWYTVSGFVQACAPTGGVHLPALAVDTQGNLYAGGGFCKIGGVSAKYVARLEGNAWYPVDSGTNGMVNALAMDAQGNLYAGGEFTRAGDVSASHVARWDGNAWYPFAGPSSRTGMGTSGGIQALAGDDQGQMYAGGAFAAAGDVLVNNLARWDGSAWHALGSGARDGNILSLAAEPQGNLYIGGSFEEIDGVSAHNIARWDGSTWNSLGGGADDLVWALALDSHSNLYAAGGFHEMDGVSAYHLARWNGSAWYPLAGNPDSSIHALVVDPQDNLYASGYIRGLFEGVGRWDGQWHSLGDANGSVHALAVDSQGNLYAGGYFTQIGGVSANHIARWDGDAWHALGSGTQGNIYAMAVDAWGNLCVGGYFGEMGGENAENIACWDGSAWHALGSGVSLGSIRALALGRDGKLYAGGSFTIAGSKPSSNIARWTPPASLQGRTWLDQNANGLQDAGEPGAPGVSVELYDSGNVLTATAITPSNGSYTIGYLRPGSYTLEFIPPYGYGLTLPDQGGDDTLDSDPDPLSGRTVPLSLTLGQAVSGWDAGLVILPFPLTVAITGTATGTVTSTPPGIACPPTCSYDFPFASPLSLRAIPAPGAVFTQWSDDAMGFSPSVTITVGGPQFITATFQPPITQTQLTLSPTLLSANGLDTATLIFTATSPTGSGPLAGRPILFSLTNQRGELADSAVSLDASGIATTTFTAGLLPGDETLFATFYENGIPIPVTSTLSLAPNPLTGRLAAGQHADLITYTFTLTNAAAFSQTVALSGSLPLHASLLTVSGAIFSPTGGDFGAGYVYTDGISLAPGESAVISWGIEALQAGDFSTLAHATGPQARLQVPVQSNVYRLFLPCVRLK